MLAWQNREIRHGRLTKPVITDPDLAPDGSRRLGSREFFDLMKAQWDAAQAQRRGQR